jgi:hypothetical protein
VTVVINRQCTHRQVDADRADVPGDHFDRCGGSTTVKNVDRVCVWTVETQYRTDSVIFEGLGFAIHIVFAPT